MMLAGLAWLTLMQGGPMHKTTEALWTALHGGTRFMGPCAWLGIDTQSVTRIVHLPPERTRRGEILLPASAGFQPNPVA